VRKWGLSPFFLALFAIACSSPVSPMDGGTGGGMQGDSGMGGGAGGGSGGGSGGGGGGGGGRVPSNHRPMPVTCTHSRPAGIPTINAPGCMSDTDCDAGADGRCNVAAGGAQVNVCTYDECFADSDCSGGAPCACRLIATANVCLSFSDCRIDSDCGDGGFCSLSPSSSFSCTPAYHCHTPNDACLSNGDCPADAGTTLCAYDTNNLAWSCTGFCMTP
jgi:hypothetical protein